jgi:TATA-box binding protein (TBP) (component of TFIID and TFIIIB)
MSANIDIEWENFISSHTDDISSGDEEEYSHLDKYLKKNAEEFVSANIAMDIKSVAPKATNIYISTKTKIAYLNATIDLRKVFWDIPIIPYSKPFNGVIKKQMKFNSTEQEELNFIQHKIKDEPYFEENIIVHIDNPTGRIKFKDIRKISIGISKKDILTYRSKKKSAFYNCFVIILRMKIEQTFKEFHVKVFNTGKLEIPGVQNETTFQLILDEVIKTLQPYVEPGLGYKPDTNETVLINSNFNCGFFINREALNDILKYKYKIQAMYDPCSYPGIQCKFYYNPDVDMQNGCQISEENKNLYKDVKEVSFMIFRTGSVLIVGKCDENVLMVIYDFLKIILNNEYASICQNYSPGDSEHLATSKDKIKKIRRKTIMVEFNS